MGKKNGTRSVITLRSSEGTGSTYTTTKNRLNQRERLELLKYDPKVRHRALFREGR